MNLKRKHFFILIMLMFCVPLKSGIYLQTNHRDSAITADVKEAFLLSNNYPDSALKIANRGIVQAQVSDNKRLAAFSYKTRGWAYFRLGNYDSCQQNLYRSIDIFAQIHDSLNVLYNYTNLGIIFTKQTEFDKAIAVLSKADSINNLMCDLKISSEINRQLGIIHRERKDYPKALSYLKQAFNYSIQLKDTSHILDAISSLCIIYTNMSHADSSLLLLKHFSPFYKSLPANDFHRASMHELAGDANLQLKNFGRAYTSYLAAYRIFVNTDDFPDQAYESINIGRALLGLEKYDDAEKYLLKAFKICDGLNILVYKYDAATQLTLVNKKKRNWPSAYNWLETEKILYDSIQYNDRTEKAAALEAKYQSEKKEKEIQLLKKDRELDKAILARKEIIQYGLIIFAGLILFIGFLTVHRYRYLQQEKRRLAIEQLRNDIARDLHDDMGSVVSGINIISKAALNNKHTTNIAFDTFRKIEQYSGYIQEKMSDIVWAITPGNDTFDKLIVKMKEFSADLLEPLNINFIFAINADFKNLHAANLNELKDFYLFFKEVINNAAKYSECSEIEIKIFKDDNKTINLEINDNGKGFDIDGVQSGNGLKNMKVRANRLNGQMTIESKKGRGTKVTLNIKSHD